MRCPNCGTEVGRKSRRPVIMTFETVRRGMTLKDQFGQQCRVVTRSMKYMTVSTQRTDDPSMLGCCATWTSKEFDARQFTLIKRVNTMKSMKKKIITQTFSVRPDQGFAAMAANLIAPQGYAFVKMVRKDTKAVVTYRLIE